MSKQQVNIIIVVVIVLVSLYRTNLITTTCMQTEPNKILIDQRPCKKE